MTESTDQTETDAIAVETPETAAPSEATGTAEGSGDLADPASPANPGDPADPAPASDAETGSEADAASVDAAALPAGADRESGSSTHRSRLVQEGDIAADYLEGLLDIADLDGDIDMDIEGDRAAVSIAGGDLGHLVGRNGEVLDALQELTRLAVLRETGERSRLMLDIEGHRARRRVELTEIGTKAAEQAKSTGGPVSLTAMTPFERKIVHDAVAAAGLISESEGVEPMRYVVVHPA